MGSFSGPCIIVTGPVAYSELPLGVRKGALSRPLTLPNSCRAGRNTRPSTASVNREGSVHLIIYGKEPTEASAERHCIVVIIRLAIADCENYPEPYFKEIILDNGLKLIDPQIQGFSIVKYCYLGNSDCGFIFGYFTNLKIH